MSRARRRPAFSAGRLGFPSGPLLLLATLGWLLASTPAPAAPNDNEPPDGTAATLGLQRRVTDLFRMGRDAVVRVKAAFEETDAQGRASLVQQVGTGFFVSRDGLVITNNSIVRLKPDYLRPPIRVWLEHDGVSYAAQLVGSDRSTNFALLRVAELPPRFSVLATGDDPSAPEPGSFALAITAPLDFPPTPSVGIVLGVDGGFGGRAFSVPYVRVGIPAHLGEGGSPVLDLNGRLVGMMIASLPEVQASYVLPGKALQRLRDDILFHGGPQAGWAGLNLIERPERGAPGGRVVVIEKIDAGTPAATAGLEAGDIVVAIDGTPVRSESDVRAAGFYSRVGQYVQLTIRRGERTRDYAVVLAAPPAGTAAPEPPPPDPTSDPTPDRPAPPPGG